MDRPLPSPPTSPSSTKRRPLPPTPAALSTHDHDASANNQESYNTSNDYETADISLSKSAMTVSAAAGEEMAAMSNQDPLSVKNLDETDDTMHEVHEGGNVSGQTIGVEHAVSDEVDPDQDDDVPLGSLVRPSSSPTEDGQGVDGNQTNDEQQIATSNYSPAPYSPATSINGDHLPIKSKSPVRSVHSQERRRRQRRDSSHHSSSSKPPASSQLRSASTSSKTAKFWTKLFGLPTPSSSSSQNSRSASIDVPPHHRTHSNSRGRRRDPKNKNAPPADSLQPVYFQRSESKATSGTRAKSSQRLRQWLWDEMIDNSKKNSKKMRSESRGGSQSRGSIREERERLRGRSATRRKSAVEVDEVGVVEPRRSSTKRESAVEVEAQIEEMGMEKSRMSAGLVEIEREELYVEQEVITEDAILHQENEPQITITPTMEATSEEILVHTREVPETLDVSNQTTIKAPEAIKHVEVTEAAMTVAEAPSANEPTASTIPSERNTPLPVPTLSEPIAEPTVDPTTIPHPVAETPLPILPTAECPLCLGTQFQPNGQRCPTCEIPISPPLPLSTSVQLNSEPEEEERLKSIDTILTHEEKPFSVVEKEAKVEMTRTKTLWANFGLSSKLGRVLSKASSKADKKDEEDHPRKSDLRMSRSLSAVVVSTTPPPLQEKRSSSLSRPPSEGHFSYTPSTQQPSTTPHPPKPTNILKRAFSKLVSNLSLKRTTSRSAVQDPPPTTTTTTVEPIEPITFVSCLDPGPQSDWIRQLQLESPPMDTLEVPRGVQQMGSFSRRPRPLPPQPGVENLESAFEMKGNAEIARKEDEVVYFEGLEGGEVLVSEAIDNVLDTGPKESSASASPIVKSATLSSRNSTPSSPVIPASAGATPFEKQTSMTSNASSSSQSIPSSSPALSTGTKDRLIEDSINEPENFSTPFTSPIVRAESLSAAKLQLDSDSSGLDFLDTQTAPLSNPYQQPAPGTPEFDSDDDEVVFLAVEAEMNYNTPPSAGTISSTSKSSSSSVIVIEETPRKPATVSKKIPADLEMSEDDSYDASASAKTPKPSGIVVDLCDTPMEQSGRGRNTSESPAPVRITATSSSGFELSKKPPLTHCDSTPISVASESAGEDLDLSAKAHDEMLDSPGPIKRTKSRNIVDSDDEDDMELANFDLFSSTFRKQKETSSTNNSKVVSCNLFTDTFGQPKEKSPTSTKPAVRTSPTSTKSAVQTHPPKTPAATTTYKAPPKSVQRIKFDDPDFVDAFKMFSTPPPSSAYDKWKNYLTTPTANATPAVSDPSIAPDTTSRTAKRKIGEGGYNEAALFDKAERCNDNVGSSPSVKTVKKSKTRFNVDSLLKEKQKRDVINKSVQSIMQKLEESSDDENVNDENSNVNLHSTVDKLMEVDGAEEDSDQARVANMIKSGLQASFEERVILYGESLPMPEVLLNYSAAPNDVFGQLVVSSLNNNSSKNAFLKSNTLGEAASKGWDMPDELLAWLIDTACFSSDPLVAVDAARNLKTWLASKTDDTLSKWFFSTKKFLKALHVYGFNENLLNGKVSCVDQLVIKVNVGSTPTSSHASNPENPVNMTKSVFSNDSVVSPFPAVNFEQCVDLYVTSLLQSSTSYPLEELENACLLFFKLSLDQRLCVVQDFLGDCCHRLSNALEEREKPENPENLAKDLSPPVKLDGWKSRLAASAALFVGTNPTRQEEALVSPVSAWTNAGLLLRQVQKMMAGYFVLAAGPGGGFERKESAVMNPSDMMEIDSIPPQESSFFKSHKFYIPVSLADLCKLADQYRVPPTSTDYVKLFGRIRVLSICIGTMDQIRADSIQSAQELILILKRIHGKINDSRLGSVERTKAKYEIHQIATWLELCLPIRTVKQGTINFGARPIT
ncbi:hypothetical protein HDV05_008262 [Chytridiales sp. JEL 0842]|nr:hypothetical protein HDV05_008262 [Chytridiales sp. JEL 0842]